MIQITQINEQQKIYNVNMPRGDTGVFDITISGYELQEGDRIEFKMGKDLNSPVITKEITNFTDNFVTINFSEGDTKDLSVGEYFYVVKLYTVEGDIDTFIEKSIFELEES